MAEEYTRAVLKKVVGQICQTIGWHSIQTTPLEVMVDVLHRYIRKVSRTAVNYSQEFGSSSVHLDTLALAFNEMGIKVEDLSEYIQNVESVPCVESIPKYPIPRESHLNFLKPGSHEVVTRPVHVHEHLPPMHPEMEEEESHQQTALSVDTSSTSGAGTSPLSSPKGNNMFKRPGEPTTVEHPAVKRARQMLEEEGRPLREISSVMMTTSGFLSPAREGKLPESRTPVLDDPGSHSPASSPSSYPMVPPEVKGEKKTKKIPIKKLPDGLKKFEDKEIKKVDTKLKDIVKVEKNIISEEPKVKKLASMKEFAKLKALKSGALKLMAQASAGALPSITGMGKIPKISNASKIPSFKTSKGNKSNVKSPKSEKPVTPNLPVQQQKSVNLTEKLKDFSMVVAKLSAEPDKQKLNIFKKISKVKEEKSERNDPCDTALRTSRESSPGPTFDETEAGRNLREIRMAQIDHCIESVIQRSIELDQAVPVVELDVKQPPLPVATVVDSDDGEVDADGDLLNMEVPAMTKISDLLPGMTTLSKPDILPEKKRKRERSKSRKDRSRSPKISPISSPKKMKLEIAELDTSEAQRFSDTADLRPSVFPFFTHFPPAPGLIPPPIGNPLFPRFPLPLGKNMPHPAMPNLALPPALFMQPREDVPEPKIGEILPEKPLRSPTPSVVVVPLPAPAPPTPLQLNSKEKVTVEKKLKEHKKEKKEKDKTKKKKDKKERLKAKAEKRKIKEEKKEREKEKLILKKEKREKRKEKEKEKERDEKSEGSVPKITFRLGPVSPRPPTPDALPRKITIKPVTKKALDVEESGLVESSVSVKREPSPELARISALITRPPKQKTSSKGSSLPCPDFSNFSSPASTTTIQPISPVPLALPPLDSATKAKRSIGKPYAKTKAKSLPPNVAKGDVKEPVSSFYHDKEGNKVWICPACGGQDDGSPMIGCDDCDAWYHWVCVGIQVPPDENEDWYCRVCIVKKQENYAEKTKKKRKKKQSSPN